MPTKKPEDEVLFTIRCTADLIILKFHEERSNRHFLWLMTQLLFSISGNKLDFYIIDIQNVLLSPLTVPGQNEIKQQFQMSHISLLPTTAMYVTSALLDSHWRWCQKYLNSKFNKLYSLFTNFFEIFHRIQEQAAMRRFKTAWVKYLKLLYILRIICHISGSIETGKDIETHFNDNKSDIICLLANNNKTRKKKPRVHFQDR